MDYCRAVIALLFACLSLSAQPFHVGGLEWPRRTGSGSSAGGFGGGGGPPPASTGCTNGYTWVFYGPNTNRVFFYGAVSGFVSFTNDSTVSRERIVYENDLGDSLSVDRQLGFGQVGQASPTAYVTVEGNTNYSFNAVTIDPKTGPQTNWHGWVYEPGTLTFAGTWQVPVAGSAVYYRVDVTAQWIEPGSSGSTIPIGQVTFPAGGTASISTNFATETNCHWYINSSISYSTISNTNSFTPLLTMPSDSSFTMDVDH
jgi:hypothetical protein